MYLFGSAQKEWGHLGKPPALLRTSSSTLSQTSGRTAMHSFGLDFLTKVKRQQNLGVDKILALTKYCH
jgi:hypothetical protein